MGMVLIPSSQAFARKLNKFTDVKCRHLRSVSVHAGDGTQPLPTLSLVPHPEA